MNLSETGNVFQNRQKHCNVTMHDVRDILTSLCMTSYLQQVVNPRISIIHSSTGIIPDVRLVAVHDEHVGHDVIFHTIILSR